MSEQKEAATGASGGGVNKIVCSVCEKLVSTGNFCEKCGEKLVTVCECWVKKMPYNCGINKCPGLHLIVMEFKQAVVELMKIS